MLCLCFEDFFQNVGDVCTWIQLIKSSVDEVIVCMDLLTHVQLVCTVIHFGLRADIHTRTSRTWADNKIYVTRTLTATRTGKVSFRFITLVHTLVAYSQTDSIL